MCVWHHHLNQPTDNRQVIPNPKGLTVGRREFESTSPSSSSTTTSTSTSSDGAAASSPSSLYYYHADIVAEAPPGVCEREGGRERRVGGWLLGWLIRVGANAFVEEIRRKTSPFYHLPKYHCHVAQGPSSSGWTSAARTTGCGSVTTSSQCRYRPTHNYSHVARHISNHARPVIV